jgi:hypothetical protein
MKVIFLDNDGVICLSTEWGNRYKKQKKWGGRKLSMSNSEIPLPYRFDNFNKKAVEVLNSILVETNAEIVVSSDWRYYASLEELGDYYTEQGIIKKPISVTEIFKDIYPSEWTKLRSRAELELERSMEIQHWLNNHPEVSNWVAIDDLNMSVEFLSNRYSSVDGSDSKPGLTNFVLTSKSSEGIKQTGIKEKVINYLSNE